MPALPENMPRKAGVDRRGLTSLVMFFSFVWLPFSGLAIHLADPNPMDRLHHVAMAVHNVAAILFLGSVVVHLVLNWKPMTRHLATQAIRFVYPRKETVVVAGIILFLVVLVGSHGLLAR